MKTFRRMTILAMAAMLLLAFVCGASADTVSEKKDNRGRVTESTRTDDSGNAVNGPEGYAVIRYVYQGEKATETYFDADGNPVRMPGGYYGRAVSRDGKGQISLIEYLDRDGNLTMTAMGYARVFYYYRSFGEEYKSVYFGTKKGEVVTVPSLGYAQVETEFSGTVMTGRTFKDPVGNPVDSLAGYASVRRKLNKNRQILQVWYSHADGKPATGPDGWSKCIMERDNKGKLTEIRYLDEKDRPTDAGGCARETYSYDSNGDAKVTRYDLSGNRIPFGGETVSVLRRMIDDRIVQETYLDEAGRATALPDGYASVVYSYNSAGNLETIQYRNAKGDKATCTRGYSAIRQSWDLQGRLVRRTFLDANGQNVNSTDGICEEQYLYDAGGKLTEVQQFDAAGTQAAPRP